MPWSAILSTLVLSLVETLSGVFRRRRLDKERIADAKDLGRKTAIQEIRDEAEKARLRSAKAANASRNDIIDRMRDGTF